IFRFGRRPSLAAMWIRSGWSLNAMDCSDTNDNVHAESRQGIPGEPDCSCGAGVPDRLGIGWTDFRATVLPAAATVEHPSGTGETAAALSVQWFVHGFK